MSQRWRTLIGIIMVVTLTAILGIIFGYQSLKNSFPKTNGSISLAGLKTPVSVIRDSISVPHIFAANVEDLYIAIGYVMAQDRLWQMELTRLAAAGRLAQIYGPTILPQDKFMRTIGLRRIAEQLEQNISPQSLKLLSAFSRGVNAYIQDNKKQLPIEFNILSYQPEPWSEIDCLISQRLMAWTMSVSGYVDLLNVVLADQLSPEYLQDLGIDPSISQFPDSTTGFAYTTFARAFLHAIDQIFKFSPVLENYLSSNAWAIGSSKTQTGKPILASDLHTALTIPSMMYQMHWVCTDAGINVSGFCFPGLPAILMGSNPAIAWSFGNALIDDVDFFIQKTNPADSSQYWLDDQLLKLRILKEEIGVRGFNSEKIQIRISRAGPIVSDLIDQNSTPIAMRWTGYEMTDELKACFEIQRAGNLNQFMAALVDYGVPGLNFIGADSGGSIGSRLAARIPLRQKNNGLFAQAGWNSQAQWQGFLPPGQIPPVFNPPEGVIVSANQKSNYSSNGVYLSSFWEPSLRAERIDTILALKSGLAPEDLAMLQKDDYSSLAQRFLPYFLQVMAAAQYKKDEVGEQAYQLLKDWDLAADRESISAGIFYVFFKIFVDLTLKDDLNEALYNSFLQLDANFILLLDKICQNPNSKWFDNCQTPAAIETRDDIIRAAVEKGLTQLRDSMGPDPGDWRWGTLHTMTFGHPFSARKILRIPFSIGPLPGQGGLATINNGSFNFRRPFKQVSGATTRLVVDLAQPHHYWSCLVPGQSGQLFYFHYKDQLPFWFSDRLHLSEKQNVILALKYDNKLILKPAER